MAFEDENTWNVEKRKLWRGPRNPEELCTSYPQRSAFPRLQCNILERRCQEKNFWAREIFSKVFIFNK